MYACRCDMAFVEILACPTKKEPSTRFLAQICAIVSWIWMPMARSTPPWNAPPKSAAAAAREARSRLANAKPSAASPFTLVDRVANKIMSNRSGARVN